MHVSESRVQEVSERELSSGGGGEPIAKSISNSKENERKIGKCF